MARFLGLDASSGYGRGTQLSCSPTGVAGPAALWYHQALAIEMSSSASHRATRGPSCGRGGGAAAFTEPMLQVKVLYSENIRLDISMIAACPTQYWLPCFGKRTAWCWSCVDWGMGTVQLKGEVQPCCPCPCGVHLSFLLKCTEKSPCSLWSLHLSVKSLKGTPLPLQQDGYR